MRILGASMSDNSELVAKSLALTPANHETRRGWGSLWVVWTVWPISDVLLGKVFTFCLGCRVAGGQCGRDACADLLSGFSGDWSSLSGERLV